MTGSKDAIEIVEALLFATGEAMATEDFERFAACFALPYEVETLKGTVTIESEAALQDMFRKNIAYYRSEGVTDMIRRCLRAEFLTPDTITCLYETRLLHFGTHAKRTPYDVSVRIVMQNSVWKCVRGTYAIQDCDAHCRALVCQKWPDRRGM